MPVRSCRVTIQDMDGASHTVEVTAGKLYEAVAQGLAPIRGNEWVARIVQGLNVVKVSVADVRVEHEVKLMDFTKWRFAVRGERPSSDSVDSGDAGLAMNTAARSYAGHRVPQVSGAQEKARKWNCAFLRA